MAPNVENNLSAVLYGVNDLRLVKRSIPEPGDHDVLLKMGRVGICGTDVSFLTKGKIGDFVVKEPRSLGHEGAGTVIKCGAKVTHLKAGDRVAIEPGIPCRRCLYCKSGRYNLCKDYTFYCAPYADGSLAQYFSHPSDFCFKLPEHVSLDEGALLEPLSVSVHACRRVGITLGSRVLICGAGPIGLASMMAARTMGATKICISDISESRLKFASSLGADCTVLIGKDQTESQLVEAIREAMGGELPDKTIECSGAESAIRLGILATESGGCVVLIGFGKDEAQLPIVNAATREVDIKGIFAYANCFPLALDMVASGKVDMKPLITHRFTLDETLKAFECAKSRTEGAIKIMISCED